MELIRCEMFSEHINYLSLAPRTMNDRAGQWSISIKDLNSISRKSGSV